MILGILGFSEVGFSTSKGVKLKISGLGFRV